MLSAKHWEKYRHIHMLSAWFSPCEKLYFHKNATPMLSHGEKLSPYVFHMRRHRRRVFDPPPYVFAWWKPVRQVTSGFRGPDANLSKMLQNIANFKLLAFVFKAFPSLWSNFPVQNLSPGFPYVITWGLHRGSYTYVFTRGKHGGCDSDALP